MAITNEQIYEKLNGIDTSLQILLRANRSDKIKLLEEETKILRRIEVGKVQTLLGGISRPWALSLMKKLGEESHFEFVIGDKRMKRPSLIIFNEPEATKERYEKIKEFVDKNKIVSYAQICEYLELPLETNLDAIKSIVSNIIENEVGYKIEEGNKVVKND